jgi:hypothetical protein
VGLGTGVTIGFGKFYASLIRVPRFSSAGRRFRLDAEREIHMQAYTAQMHALILLPLTFGIDFLFSQFLHANYFLSRWNIRD